MKKILSTLAIILAGTQLFATVRTCNNNNPSPGQYSTFASVMAASSSGDTIYLSGSPVSYGNVTINSYVRIFGTGYNPQKQNPLVSQFTSVTTSGCWLYGIVTGSIQFNTTVGNIHLIRCIADSITTNGYGADLYATGCVIKGLIDYHTGSDFFEIYNCIIADRILLTNFSSHKKLKNNVFVGGSLNFMTNYSGLTGGAIVSNNVFYGLIPDVTGIASADKGIFTHNISYINTFPDDDGNNIVANPLFVNVPIGTTAYNPAHDYHLQATSPGVLNLGDDLTQRGIYGSILPNTFSVTGMPGIPSIQTMSVTPSTVLSGQSIQVNFSSKTNQ